MGELIEAIVQALDDMPDEVIVSMLSDFMGEYRMTGEFLVWLGKWKANHKI